MVVEQLRSEMQNQGEYFKKINVQNLEKINYYQQMQDPLSLLLSIYYKRDDLKKAFPEVLEGNYSNLLKWAKIDCLGSDDWSRDELLKYENYFLKYESKLDFSNKETKKGKLQLEIQEIESEKVKVLSLNKHNESEIAKLLSLNKHNESEIAKLLTSNQHKESELDKIQSLIQEKESEIAKLLSVSVERDAEIDELRNEIKKIQKTLTWRIINKYASMKKNIRNKKN